MICYAVNSPQKNVWVHALIIVKKTGATPNLRTTILVKGARINI